MTRIFGPVPSSATPVQNPIPAARPLPGQRTADQPQQAGHNGAPPLAAAPVPRAPVTPERETQIRDWLAENADSQSGWFIFQDSDGGTRTAQALRGQSSLGQLTEAERQMLAQGAVEAWTAQDGGARRENMREAADGVANDPAARFALAQALAGPELRAQQGIAQAGAILTTPEASEAAYDGLEQALRLDAGAVAQSFDGLEPQLARLMQERPDQRAAMWQALGNGTIPASNAERMTTAMFMFEDGQGIQTQSGREAFARAIADARRPGDSSSDRIARDQMASNITAALADSDTRDMLLGQEISPEQRLWALDQIAADGRCVAPDAFDDGWESEAASRGFAAEVNDTYRARGTEPQTLGGEALRNTVGQAMGIAPDQLPQGELTEAFLAQGMDNAFYSRSDTNQALDRVADQIAQVGGPNAQVSVVPVTVTSNDEGAAVVPVFRVETDQGPQFVDHNGRRYSDLNDWEENNTLPEGKMTYAEGLDLNSTQLSHRNTPGVVDTFAEGFGKVMDGVAIAAGVVAGVAIIAGSGGTAAPLVAGGAALWMTGRAGQDLYDMQQHGQDIGDLSDPSVRGAWLEVAAGALSVGAIGGALRLGSAGAQVSPALARTVAGVGLAAEGVDALTMADQAMQLGQNWDHLSGGERAGALLNIAFWGGMAGASHMAGRTGTPDGSFAGIDQRIRMGAGAQPDTRFPLETGVDGLAPGEMRVAYDMQNGRATNIRIQSGDANPDPVQLALHIRSANQMQTAGGLSDRLGALMTGRADPPVGSSAWEARAEIDKIQRESQALAQDAANATTLADQQRIATRQRELDQALIRETRRLDAAVVDGQGFIAAPRSLDEILAQRVANGDVTRGVPAHLAPLAAPAAGAEARIDYGSLNAAGQAQGIEATITRDILDTGSKAQSSIEPPGWGGGAANHSRGHLLARMLGGSGSEEANLVTLFQQNTNSPVMSDFERLVYEAVDAGETVNYRVTPIYEEGQAMPTAVALQARGDQGLDISVTIINRDGR
ncbi:DUF4781 domain-containing protein [Paracoccus laeviglucosivorans]|uniref:DNA/RNA non-specific endonuclease n=1 Tax=Paracoccus laeviglucosivorans TaxID=1197861 RepID=A0A521BFB6_9RHOB|nr:DUF4781 domain-containing protein [Paracoccus laeviglucosivorans]SMO45769.1 DNA/RNA non-specific endonuclease [Paracoccus laeviglucosivorans]